MRVKHVCEGFEQVLEQVQAIGHLGRRGRTMPGPVSIGADAPCCHAELMSL